MKKVLATVETGVRNYIHAVGLAESYIKVVKNVLNDKHCYAYNFVEKQSIN